MCGKWNSSDDMGASGTFFQPPRFPPSTTLPTSTPFFQVPSDTSTYILKKKKKKKKKIKYLKRDLDGRLGTWKGYGGGVRGRKKLSSFAKIVRAIPISRDSV